VQTLLAHKEESAGGVLDTNCIEALTTETAASIIDRLRTLPDDVKVYNLVYVVNEKRELKGVISLRGLFRAAPEATLGTIMDEVLVHVSPQTRLKEVARELAKFGFQAIPVVDDNGVFMGIVRYDSALSQLADFLKD